MKKFLCCVLAVMLMLSLVACGGDINANVTEGSGETTQSTQSKNETMTMGQKIALKKAKSYLNTMAFSRDGLIKQLEFEGFSNEDSVFAVDNCNADWNEQAAKKAKSYLNTMAFSRDGLINQLEFEGFTTEQAEYGATANGY